MNNNCYLRDFAPSRQSNGDIYPQTHVSIVGTQNYFSPDLIYNQKIILEKSNDNSTTVDWKKNDIFSLGLTFQSYKLFKVKRI